MTFNIEVKSNSIAIVGWYEGTAGRIETWLEKTHKYHIACFINPSNNPPNIKQNKIKRDSSQFSYPTKDSFKSRPLINKLDWAKYLIKLGINKALITTDDQKERYKQITYAKKKKINLINAIHPKANVMSNVILKNNIIIHEDSTIGYKVELYDGAFIDGAYLAHHTVVKECSTILPGCITGGNVTIGKFSRLYLGAIITNKISIGNNTVIGAGSRILKNVENGKLVADRQKQIKINNKF